MRSILLIALLFCSTLYSQTPLTVSEKNELIKNVTKEKLQEWANNKKEVKELISIVKIKEKTIDSLGIVIVNERVVFRRDLKKIKTENNSISQKTKEIEIINKNTIKKLNIKWSEVHLYFNTEIPNFNDWQQTKFSSELVYDFNRVRIGINGGFKRIIQDINNKPTYQFEVGLLINFKIF